jgi:hypothetical protein
LYKQEFETCVFCESGVEGYIAADIGAARALFMVTYCCFSWSHEVYIKKLGAREVHMTRRILDGVPREWVYVSEQFNSRIHRIERAPTCKAPTGMFVGGMNDGIVVTNVNPA